MSPQEMLAEAEQTLKDYTRLHAVPRAVLAMAWVVLAVATKYVGRSNP